MERGGEEQASSAPVDLIRQEFLDLGHAYRRVIYDPTHTVQRSGSHRGTLCVCGPCLPSPGLLRQSRIGLIPEQTAN